MAAELPERTSVQLPPDDRRHHSERVRPVEAPFASYASNRMCLFVDGRQVWLTPGEPRLPDTALNVWPEALPAPVTYLSAWNPDGERHTLQQNLALHEQLRTFIRELRLDAIEAVTVAQGGEWFEQGLAVIGMDDQLAHDLAWKYDQDGWIRLDERGWQAASRYQGFTERARSFTVLRRTRRRCPIRAIEAKADRCIAVGGPWTSSSRSAYAVWNAHRRIGITLLGCGSCRDGKQPVWMQGGTTLIEPGTEVITLRELCIASRFGGYCWGRRTEYDWTAHVTGAIHERTRAASREEGERE